MCERRSRNLLNLGIGMSGQLRLPCYGRRLRARL
jgi:hypothetical protein